MVKLSRRWKARILDEIETSNDCQGMAKRIQSSIGGEIKTIKPKPHLRAKFLGFYCGVGCMWSFHEVVIKENRVFDAFTGFEGLSIEEFKARWESADSIDFNF